MARRVSTLRSFEHPGLKMASRFLWEVRRGDLAEAWRQGDDDYATVAMRYSIVERTLDRASGGMVDGDTNPQEATELWTFRRTLGGQWVLSAVQQA